MTDWAIIHFSRRTPFHDVTATTGGTSEINIWSIYRHIGLPFTAASNSGVQSRKGQSILHVHLRVEQPPLQMHICAKDSAFIYLCNETSGK
jgi:hypothetical protein